jgi:hypothetical protein
MTESDFKQLLGKNAELKNHDFKLTINWETSTKEERGKLIKDILAMTNTQDGGNILFGVRDEDYEFVGMPEDAFSTLDSAKVNDLLHRYADPKVSCEVFKLKIDGKLAACISVAEFQETPNICKETLNSSDNKAVILRAGAVYIRSDDGKSITAGAHEIRELLGRALIKRRDGLLEDIRGLLLGKPKLPDKTVEEQYAAEIQGADSFLNSTVVSKFTHHGGWEALAYPTSYEEERIPRPQEVRQRVEAAEVRLRGWYFPHTDHKEAGYFANGFQSLTNRPNHQEGYRAYQSGLFAWKELFWEDLAEKRDDDKRRVRSHSMVIYEVTEFCLFLRRYYENLPSIDAVRVKLVMRGLANRALVSFDPGILMDDNLVCKESTFVFDKVLSTVDLKASSNEIANRLAQRIMLLFGWDDVTEESINHWQQKLIERKY